MKDQTSKVALKLYEDLEEAHINGMMRWNDEGKYEDIADYSVLFKEQIEAVGGRFIKMMQKPFGYTYELEDRTYKVWVQGDQYIYRRIT